MPEQSGSETGSREYEDYKFEEQISPGKASDKNAQIDSRSLNHAAQKSGQSGPQNILSSPAAKCFNEYVSDSAKL